MSKAENTFRRNLSSKRRAWQCVDTLPVLLRTLGAGVLLLGVYVLADAYFAFTPRGLHLGNVTALFLTGATLVFGLMALFGRSLKDTAQRVDAITGPDRRSVQSALDLHEVKDEAPLHNFLVDQGYQEASQVLRQTSDLRLFNGKRCLRMMLFTLACAAFSAAVLLGNPLRAAIVLSRMMHPHADIPPYSPYAFALTPETPMVLYGGDIDLAAEITQHPVEEKVWMLTRRDGEIKRAACFREGRTRFNQRLEKVVAPVDVCFAVGKARSPWHRVDVQMQPEVTDTRVTIAAPAYTLQPTRTFRLGAEPINGFAESSVSLRVTSNRPLGSGGLTLDDGEALHAIEGTIVDVHAVEFSWSLMSSASLLIDIRDVRGVGIREKIEARQILLPDEVPYVTINNPPRFSLATPSTKLPFEGYAEDDLHVKDVELMRAMVGYRDHPKQLAQQLMQPRFDYTDQIDLATLGTAPGQTLEFYLEARDSHPNERGIGVSEIIRVNIISEEAYADMLRSREKMQQLSRRFNLAHRQISKMTEKLKELQQTDDPAEQERLRAEAQHLAEETQRVFNELAKDFPIYDLEKEAQPGLKALAEEMKKNAAEIAGMKPGSPSFGKQLQDMLDRLAPQQEQLKQEAEDAEGITQAGEVMQKTIDFRRIVQQQEDLVRQMNRFAKDLSQSAKSRMARLAQKERALRDELDALATELEEKAAALPPKFHELRYGAQNFVKALRESEVLEPMEASALAGQNQNHARAYEQAKLALERMQALTEGEDNNSFSQMCKGNTPKFDVRDSVQNTLAQMLAALQGKRGEGQGSGKGIGSGQGGMGGDSEDGYAVGGQSAINVPLYGPGRSTYAAPRGGVIEGGEGAGGQAGRSIVNAARSGFESSQNVVDPDGGIPIDRIPPKYREAIKRYFTHGEAQ
jgi:hypothetical protein